VPGSINNDSHGIDIEYVFLGTRPAAAGGRAKFVYPSANTYTTCFTATNSGGADAVCHPVTVTLVPSTTRSAGQTIDMDGDALAELQVQSPGCAPIALKMHMVNGTRATTILEDYRTVVQADAIAASNYSDTDRCVPAYEISQTILLIGTSGHYIKAWQPANTASGIRFQFAVMGVATLFGDGFEGGNLLVWVH